MLNEERIRLMTRMAAFEQGEGQENLKMSQYYRKDYVGIQMIKTFICSTAAFGILFLLQIFYEMDAWIEEFYRMDLMQLGLSVFIKYIIFTLAYQVIAYVVYSLRYKKGHRSVRQYQARLKKVMKSYEKEEKNLSTDD